jgi:hypothetical protein
MKTFSDTTKAEAAGVDVGLLDGAFGGGGGAQKRKARAGGARQGRRKGDAVESDIDNDGGGDGGDDGGGGGGGGSDGGDGDDGDDGDDGAAQTKSRARKNSVPATHEKALEACTNIMKGLSKNLGALSIKTKGLNAPKDHQVMPGGIVAYITSGNQCLVFHGGGTLKDDGLSVAASAAIEKAVRAALNCPRRVATRETATARVPDKAEVVVATRAAFPPPRPLARCMVRRTSTY